MFLRSCQSSMAAKSMTRPPMTMWMILNGSPYSSQTGDTASQAPAISSNGSSQLGGTVKSKAARPTMTSPMTVALMVMTSNVVEVDGRENSHASQKDRS